MTQEIQQLSKLLIQETNIANNLLDLMLDEKNTLEENLPEKLSGITTSKAGCLDQMEAISRNKIQLLLGLSSAPTNVERQNQFIARQSSSIQKELNQLVDELEDAIEKCRHQNSINGMIIAMNQRNVQRNLNIIKGADQESMTYTQKGQTTAVGKAYGGMKV